MASPPYFECPSDGLILSVAFLIPSGRVAGAPNREERGPGALPLEWAGRNEPCAGEARTRGATTSSSRWPRGAGREGGAREGARGGGGPGEKERGEARGDGGPARRPWLVRGMEVRVGDRRFRGY